MSCSTVTFMRFIMVLGAMLAVARAGPRYIAIPIDNVDVIELSPVASPPMMRNARHADAALYVQQPQPHLHEPSIEPPQPQPLTRAERATAAHILDYVDFGAHTGPNGAFSWYADYPSHH